MEKGTTITVEFGPQANQALEKRKKRTGVPKTNIVKRATAKELGLID